MSKTGRQYADEVRELRAAGFDFPASRGYRLASPSQWSSGLKSAVTRAYNSLESERAEPSREESGLDERYIEQEYWEDAAGDGGETWDDIDYLDFEEADDLDDEEADDYEEGSG